MAYVKIYYGPYELCGLVRHRTERLRGLKAELEMRAHTVELIPSPHWDRVDVEVGGRTVFRCGIVDLEYVTDGEEDVVCMQAVRAVDQAVRMIKPEFLYPNIPLFSGEFFEEIIGEAFKLLSIHEFINECFDKSVAYVKILDCLPLHTNQNQPLADEFKSYLVTTVEETLHKDLVDDLLQEQLQENFDTEEHADDSILDSIETREFLRGLIIEAISQTRVDIRNAVSSLVKYLVTQTWNHADPRYPQGRASIASVLSEARKLLPHPSVRTVVSELVQKASFKSRRSRSTAGGSGSGRFAPTSVAASQETGENIVTRLVDETPSLLSEDLTTGDSYYLGSMSFDVSASQASSGATGAEKNASLLSDISEQSLL